MAASDSAQHGEVRLRRHAADHSHDGGGRGRQQQPARGAGRRIAWSGLADRTRFVHNVTHNNYRDFMDSELKYQIDALTPGAFLWRMRRDA